MHRNIYFFSSGAASVGGKALSKKSKVKVRPDVAIVLSAPAGAAEFLVLQGRDLAEPVVQHGPFVGNTQRDIMQAFSDYQRTGFGDWPHGGDAPVFAREKGRFSQAPGAALVEKPIPR